MKKKLFWERFVLIFSVCVCISAAFFPMLEKSVSADIYSCVTRLHILANSDSSEDQALKLKVRDDLLVYMAGLVNGANDLQQANRIICSNLENIKKVALESVKSHGYSYEVGAEFTNEYYPTREYEGFRLPAGSYSSLRVSIGRAEGKNWWCVLYPPLCTSIASFKEESVQTGFTPDQIRFLTEDEDPKYVFRFKISETIAEIKYRLKKIFRR